MMDFQILPHAEKRMRQRGIHHADIEWIIRYGISTEKFGALLSNKDVEREIAVRRREIQLLERLRNKKAVVNGDNVITCYHTTKNHQKLFMRKISEGD